MAKHFSQWEWAGFAWRRLASEAGETEGQMHTHLASGCEACVREYEFWKKLGDTLRFEHEPPIETWEEGAKALPGRELGLGPADFGGSWGARLIFDNLAVAPPSTVRGLPARRHCVYALERGGRELNADASLDVMCERTGPYDSWSVTGQILSASGQGWRDCLVELSGGTETSSKGARLARSNGFGEFVFGGIGGGPWCLDIQAGQQHWGIAPLLMP